MAFILPIPRTHAYSHVRPAAGADCQRRPRRCGSGSYRCGQSTRPVLLAQGGRLILVRTDTKACSTGTPPTGAASALPYFQTHHCACGLLSRLVPAEPAEIQGSSLGSSDAHESARVPVGATAHARPRPAICRYERTCHTRRPIARCAEPAPLCDLCGAHARPASGRGTGSSAQWVSAARRTPLFLSFSVPGVCDASPAGADAGKAASLFPYPGVHRRPGFARSPGFRPDRGQAAQLQVQAVPALYLAAPDGQFADVGQGCHQHFKTDPLLECPFGSGEFKL